MTRFSRALLRPSLLTLVPRLALGREAGSVQGPAGTWLLRGGPSHRTSLPNCPMPLLGHQGTLWCPVGCLCLKGGFRKRGLRPLGWEGPRPGPSSVPRCLEPDSDCRGRCPAQGHPGRRQWPLLPSSWLCQVHTQNTGPCSAQLFREPFRGKKMRLKMQTWVLGFSDLTTGPRRAPGQRWGGSERPGLTCPAPRLGFPTLQDPSQLTLC